MLRRSICPANKQFSAITLKRSFTTIKGFAHKTSVNSTCNQTAALPSFFRQNSFIKQSQYSKQFFRFFAIQHVKVPTLGDSITEGTLIKWTKQENEHVNSDDVIVVIETDKVSVDIRSPFSGQLQKHLVKEEETVKVGQDIATIDTSVSGSPTNQPTATPNDKPVQTSTAQSQVPQSQEHVKIAHPPQEPLPSATEKPPTPPKGMEGKYAATPNVAVDSSKSDKSHTVSTFVLPKGTRNERRVPMTRMRQTIANRLKHAQNTAASLTTFNEIDMTNIMALRNKYKDDFAETHGIKLGFMSAFVKAATSALQKQPIVNAYIDGTDLIYHDYIDISVAVSTPTGLVVPVLRNCETMSFAEVESAINALGLKARKGQIAIEDMVGGTFTISNGGVFGSLFGTPILNPPQSAILGMHGIFNRPIAIKDKIEIRPMMYVALTYDHRIIDGGQAVTFLKDIKNAVEDPQRLLLDL